MDFSDWTHRREIFECWDKKIHVDSLIPPSWYYGWAIVFTNTDNNLTITWEFGNWVFYRAFVPSATDERISDPYWCEKLRCCSTQSAWEYSMTEADREIDEIIEWLEEYWYEWEELEEIKEWWEELKVYTESEIEFLYHAHYKPWRPDSIDSEMIPNWKIGHSWLNTVFDAFEIICIKMQNDS